MKIPHASTQPVASRTFECPDCRYRHLVPSDYRGVPVCPRCLYQATRETTVSPWPRRLKAVGVAVLRLIVAAAVGLVLGTTLFYFSH